MSSCSHHPSWALGKGPRACTPCCTARRLDTSTRGLMARVEQVVTWVTGWRLPQQTVLLIKREAGRLCFNQLIASLGIQHQLRFCQSPGCCVSRLHPHGDFRSGAEGCWEAPPGALVCIPHFPCRGNEPQIEGEEKKGSAKNVLRETKLSYDPGLPLLRPGALSNQAGSSSKLKSVESL